MYGSPARLRLEREAARRGNASVVITTLLSLLVVAGAVAAVAYLVLRAPSSTVDSAERLEPIGTAISAPTEQPTLPTPVPTTEPEPTALGFTGEAPTAEPPSVTELPTVPAAQPQEAQDTGPTPTPRVIALPTEAPPTPLPTAPPQPTLPPAIPVESIPVVALEPVEVAPAPVATSEPDRSGRERQPTPEPTEVDDDPFNIFEPDEVPRIVQSQNDNLDRARELQDRNDGGESGGNRSNQENRGSDSTQVDIPEIVVPTPEIPVIQDRDGSIEIVMPDVEATVAAITARATDPNRNPNVRSVTDRDETPTPRSNRKNPRNSNRGRPIPTPRAGNLVPSINPSSQGQGGNGDCPFANLPEDMRPKDWPFGNC